MRVLSLFDGIACGYEALIEAGVRVDKYYASEIDQDAIDVAISNHPDIIELGDVNILEVPDNIDLLLGGSPCQDLSRNGKHKGLEGARSGLFYKYVDILYKLRTNNQGVYFLLENVEMSKENEDVITKMLGVKPIHINSRDYVAQNRPRVYWTNIPFKPRAHNVKPLDKIIDILNHKVSDISDNEYSLIIGYENDQVLVRQATKKGYAIASHNDGINLSFPTSKTRRGRVTKGCVATLDCQCSVCFSYHGNIYKVNRLECERLQGLPDNYTRNKPDRVAKRLIGNGWTVPVIADILKGMEANQ